jgi:hypothetical protein
MNTAILVATFPDYSSANNAARELENLGISRDAINVHSNQKTAGAGSVAHENEGESHSGFIGWWKNLFGSDNNSDDRRNYEEHLESGRTILRATVSDEMIDSAISALNRNGAIEIQHNEQSSGDPSTGWTRSVPQGGVRVYSHNEPLVRTGTPATGMPPRTPAPGVKSGFGFTAGTSTLAGEATTGLNAKDFTPEYGRKFEQMYPQEPGFDAMTPAYQYGHRTGGESRFRDRSWDEIENEIRAGWEKDNPGARWDSARESVRQGWDNARRTRQQ